MREQRLQVSLDAFGLQLIFVRAPQVVLDLLAGGSRLLLGSAGHSHGGVAELGELVFVRFVLFPDFGDGASDVRGHCMSLFSRHACLGFERRRQHVHVGEIPFTVFDESPDLRLVQHIPQGILDFLGRGRSELPHIPIHLLANPIRVHVAEQLIPHRRRDPLGRVHDTILLGFAEDGAGCLVGRPQAFRGRVGQRAHQRRQCGDLDGSHDDVEQGPDRQSQDESCERTGRVTQLHGQPAREEQGDSRRDDSPDPKHVAGLADGAHDRPLAFFTYFRRLGLSLCVAIERPHGTDPCRHGQVGQNQLERDGENHADNDGQDKIPGRWADNGFRRTDDRIPLVDHHLLRQGSDSRQ